MKATFATLLALALAAATANAAPLIYEPFDYDAGDLSTESGSVWGDSGTTVESGSLSYGSLVTAGSRVTMSDDSSWTSTGSAFNGYLDNGDTLWFSVLVNPHSTGTNPDFGFALGEDRLNDSNNVPMSNSGRGLGFRFKGGLKATSWSGNPSSASGTSVTAQVTHLVVGEMIFGATGSDLDTINIYLPDNDLNLGSAVSTQTATFDQTLFDTITFADKTASPRDQLDEIRFGASYDEVIGVPEPASLVLLGLGGLMIGTRRRRG